VAAGTYDFRVFITNSVNGAFRSDFETVTNIVVTGAPTASGFARSDSTVIPSQPSTLSFSSSNNQVTTSWTNGSPITSVNFAASGAGVNTNYTDTSAPFITSDLSNYSSSGTYTATVTNFNNSLQVRASWNQSNSQSYQVNYSSSVFGSDQTAIINNSGSSVNHDIGWSSGMGSFTFQSVTLWSGANGTGTSNTFTTGLTAITPTQKSSSRSGSVSLTYSLPKLATPTGVLASDNRTDGINVTWNAVSGAAYYGVWYGPTPSYDSPPDFENITSTSYLDTSMGAGVTRNYYVQAFRSGNPAGTKSDWGGPDSGTRVAPVSIPSGGSVSLTGGSTAGSIITASTSGWSGSPTSYDVYITTALSPNIPTSSSSRVASSGGGSSTTYTITSSDAISPVNIFRAFATASNSAGTSGTVQSSNTITTTSSSPATQPGTPGTPTNGWTGGTTYPFSWTAPGAGTVAGGGAATITNYSMRIYEATNSSGTGATLISTFNTGSGSSSYTYTSPNAANYYAASVAAINSAGLQGPYSGISQYK
jgi:hypothetical protein